MSARETSELSFGDRVADAILWRLGRVGIKITPFVSIRECATNQKPMQIAAGFRLCQLTEADIADVFSLDPVYSPEKMSQLFKDGKLCFGLREGSRLVAKTWCDLDEVNSSLDRRRLNAGEAYLFAAFADPVYRGKNLAPMLRSACYEELRKRGVSRFSSISLYFNLPARRFKKKLGAVEEELKVHIDLFQKWSRTVAIRKYRV